tara:strand:+ start:2470 stop:3045 length:576 start_codon:yes stop_codon:yes gene_type:complete
MPDSNTIQNFFAAAGQKQFARDFLFRVRLIQLGSVGVTIGSQAGDPSANDLIYARTASLPGRTIENKEVNYMGLTFNLPGRATYANSAGYTIEFYADANNTLREKLETASRNTFNDQTSTGEYGMPDTNDIIELVTLDKQLETVGNGIRLVGASIRDIGDISYAIADGTGEVVTFPVTFSYHFYDDFRTNQ